MRIPFIVWGLVLVGTVVVFCAFLYEHRTAEPEPALAWSADDKLAVDTVYTWPVSPIPYTWRREPGGYGWSDEWEPVLLTAQQTATENGLWWMPPESERIPMVDLTGAWVVMVDGREKGLLPEDTRVFQLPPLEPAWNEYRAVLMSPRVEGEVVVRLTDDPDGTLARVELDGRHRWVRDIVANVAALNKYVRAPDSHSFRYRFQGQQGYADIFEGQGDGGVP